MAIGYLVLTVTYYMNVWNARDLVFMSTSLFGRDGNVYNQTAILTPDYKLDPEKLQEVGLPRFTATFTVSQLFYNMSLGAALVHVVLWNWKELKEGARLFLSLHSSSVAIPNPSRQLLVASGSCEVVKRLTTSTINVCFCDDPVVSVCSRRS